MTVDAPALPQTTSGLRWRNRFAALGPDFHTRLMPTPLPAPYWVGRSDAVAAELGLSHDWLDSDAALAAFTGNQQLDGSAPLATVYSGHQFGVWAGQLGDGRALLLAETKIAALEGGSLHLGAADGALLEARTLPYELREPQ